MIDTAIIFGNVAAAVALLAVLGVWLAVVHHATLVVEEWRVRP